MNSLNPKEHIQKTFAELTNNTRWCEDMSDVEKHSTTLLANGLFFSELLQNADDAKATWIQFKLEGSHLIFSHNGKHFEYNDVEKIIRFANSTIVDKSTNSEATGYKGIGFKSLGSIAHKIYIFSQGYRFHFDQSCWGTQRKPWQMIPIWTEDTHIPTSLRETIGKIDHVIPQPVVFLFALRDPLNVKSQLQNIPNSSSDRFLFTRKVEQIHLSISQQTQFMMVRKDSHIDKSLIRTINADQSEKYRYLVFSQEINIPPNVLRLIQQLDSSICPQRLKNGEPVKVDFALPMEQDTLVKRNHHRLFSTFPTQVEIGLPFHINAEFILKHDRQGLYPSIWNEFIIEELISYHFSILNQVALNPTSYKQVLLLLASHNIFQSASSGVDCNFCQAYERGFKKGRKNIPFIPSFIDPKHLLKLDECIVDKTGFYAEFKDFLSTPRQLVHPELEEIGKLDFIPGVRVFQTLADIVGPLITLCEKNRNPDFCFRVLKFLSKNNFYDLSPLKDRCFILTQAADLCSLAKLNLPNPQVMLSIPSYITLSVLHPKVLELDVTKEIEKWLRSQQCLPISAGEIIRKHVQPILKAGESQIEKNIELVRFLFQLYHAKAISSSELETLKEIRVITRERKLAVVSDLYLYSFYDPLHRLEEILEDSPNLFVSSIYAKDDEPPHLWRDFFVALGSKTECQLQFPNPSSVAQLRKAKIYLLEEYFSYLYRFPDQVIGRGSLETDTYTNFIYFPNLNLLNRSTFSSHFWKSISLLGNRWLQLDKLCQFNSPNRQVVLHPKKWSYLQYILRTQKLIRGTDGKFHSSTELFCPRFKDFGIAFDTNIQVEDEVAAHLGFKTSLTSNECLEHLERLRKEQVRDLPLYTLLLNQFALNLKAIGKRDCHFLAADNSWQSVRSLKYCPTDVAPTQAMAGSWFKNVLSHEEMLRIADHFECPIKDHLADLDAIEDPKPDSDLRNLLIQRLPLIAWMISQLIDRAGNDYLLELARKIKRFHIFKVKKLPSIDGKGKLKSLGFKNRLYYVEDWKNDKMGIGNFLGQFFEFDQTAIELLREILDLKEESRRVSKTIKAFVEEHNIPIQNLVALIENFDFTLLADDLIEPAVKPTPKKLDHNEELEKMTAKVGELKITPESPLKLPVGSALNSPVGSPLKPLIEKHPVPMIKRAKESKQKEWKAALEVAQLLMGPKVNKMIISPNAKPSTAPDSSKNLLHPKKQIKGKTPLSDIAKAEIGKWGEEFVFRHLFLHYTMKKGFEMIGEPNSESYTLKFNDRTITVEWLNASEESFKPFDLIMRKTKAELQEVRYIEVKASKGKKTRFFLSENEMRFVENNQKELNEENMNRLIKKEKDNYRLFFVPNAGTANAQALKITNLSEWIRTKQAQVTEHKNFEVNI